ncbi:rRNA adenine N-6-methyltransferase family protein [Streptomyces sp. NBC_01304]|uniref:rRNA adenine N-6-methyltransferase family protein n=1 Tax=Streptomyces sp. NBC_01304 TaxID=2903818 RepID=UPI002E1539E9|nr:methyltransferase domain-containing protein [Streptomyces sp. NBC_01304]
MDAAALRAQCAEEIATRYGYFDDAAWLRAIFEQVPREHFTPDRVWWPKKGEDGLYPLLDRTTEPNRWLKAVYRPLAALITQISDGEVRPEDGPTDSNDWTSSISCPAVVVNMLRHLNPQPGERVLEIGTGTGYSTALLAERVGHVVSVEIDEELAKRAELRLRELGYGDDRVEVHAVDGEHGWKGGAPYDRIISAVGLGMIPTVWLHLVRRGGVILAPLDTPMGSDALVRLDDCDGQGSGRGPLITGVHFMRMRSQRERRPWAEYGWPEWADWEVSIVQGEQRIRTRD